MDLKDLDRIRSEQAERQKFRNVLSRFEEGANLRNIFICVIIIVGLVFGAYGLKEMNLFPGVIGVEETADVEAPPEDAQ